MNGQYPGPLIEVNNGKGANFFLLSSTTVSPVELTLLPILKVTRSSFTSRTASLRPSRSTGMGYFKTGRSGRTDRPE